MKHQWVAYAIVAVLGIGVGIAVAGAPSSAPVDPTIVVPATEVAALETPETVVAEVASTVAPEPTTTVTTTTEVQATTVAPETTTTVPESVLTDRADQFVVVANGADVGGIAGATANDLEDLGYVDVRATDGTEIVFFTIVYYVEGFQPNAERLAIDIGLEITSIAPIEDAPEIIGGLRDEDLLVYLGGAQA